MVRGQRSTLINGCVQVISDDSPLVTLPAQRAGFYIATFSFFLYPARAAGQGFILQQFPLLLLLLLLFFFSFCQHTNISETLCPMILILGHSNKSVNAHF